MNIDAAFLNEIKVRQRFYLLSDQERELIASLKPAVTPYFRPQFQAHIDVIHAIPHYKATLDRFGLSLLDAASAHFAALAECRFDEDYARTLKHFVEIAAQSGFGIGARLSLAPIVSAP